jgi:predicted oxidoreductase
MSTSPLRADVVIAGGGLAGLVVAAEVLDGGRSVLVLDKDTPENLGGLAKQSFGGVHLVGTPHQRRLGIRDSPELAWRDWQSVAFFGDADEWPMKWARLYCERSDELVYRFLDERGVRFLPLVNWPERGLYQPGNSVPRWHITWGTGFELVERISAALQKHAHRNRLQLLFGHGVDGIETQAGRASAFVGTLVDGGQAFRAEGEDLVIASGGMCGGDLSKVRAHWYKPWGEPPPILLNGAHRYGDGLLQDKAVELGARLTHLDKQWNYAAGVHHPAKRRPHDGLSLVPPRSALWMNARGERIGPVPLVPYADTRWLVEEICRQPGQYSWQVLNWKIAIKELAVSGCDYMTAFRFKKRGLMLKNLLLGDKDLVRRLMRDCPDDVVAADSLPELVDRMNERSLFGLRVDLAAMERDISAYDAQIDRGPAFFNDDQLRRLQAFRTYRGDRVRTCRFQKILDPAARPLIAIREFILARKSLGGLQTDLDSRVLREDGTPVPGLYAVGEAAGFGGGGSHGRGALEGTFLGGCVLTGRRAGFALRGGGGGGQA